MGVASYLRTGTKGLVQLMRIEVRNVSPKKNMFCASFRLSEGVKDVQRVDELGADSISKIELHAIYPHRSIRHKSSRLLKQISLLGCYSDLVGVGFA